MFRGRIPKHCLRQAIFSPLLATGPKFDPLSHPSKPKATDVHLVGPRPQAYCGCSTADHKIKLQLYCATALLLTSQIVPLAVPILLRYCSSANFTNCFVSTTMCPKQYQLYCSTALLLTSQIFSTALLLTSFLISISLICFNSLIYLCRLKMKYNHTLVCLPIKNLFSDVYPFCVPCFQLTSYFCRLKFMGMLVMRLANHLNFFQFYKLTIRRCTWNNSLGCTIFPKYYISIS